MSQVLKVKKRPRTIRIAGAPQSRAAAPQERDWVLHAVIGLQILPPRGPDEGHYQNVDDRMQITFQWLWTGEHKAADAPFSPDRIGRISLRKLLNEATHVCGMYLVALRHFCVDLARAAPKHAVVIDSMFGEYDPIAH